MGQILHGSATTTEAARRAIQNSQASLRELANRHGINPKTVAKWRRRITDCDARMGPKEPHSSVLAKEEEALIVAYLMAYNFAKRLKILRGLTPYEQICKVWTTQPKRFRLNPLHHTLGLNT